MRNQKRNESTLASLGTLYEDVVQVSCENPWLLGEIIYLSPKTRCKLTQNWNGAQSCVKGSSKGMLWVL